MDTNQLPLIIITSPDNALGDKVKNIPEGVIKVLFISTVSIETTMTIIYNGTVTKIL